MFKAIGMKFVWSFASPDVLSQQMVQSLGQPKYSPGCIHGLASGGAEGGDEMMQVSGVREEVLHLVGNLWSNQIFGRSYMC